MHFNILLLALLPAALGAPASSKSNSRLAPLKYAPDKNDVVPNSYIVKFKDSGGAITALDDVLSTVNFKKGRRNRVLKNVFSGFTSTLDEAALKAIRENPAVEYVEQDSVVTASGWVTQKNAPWGLARISSRKAGKTGYVYGSSGGQGTCSYIIDTGVQANHPEFGGRAVQLASFVDGTGDDNGHGTHVAGIIGSKTYGVSKRTKLIGIKVLSATGAGSISSVLAGLDLVVSDSKTRYCPKGVYVNMSLGGGYSSAMNSGAKKLVAEHGIFVAVAAGNSGEDASNSSPASEPSVFTVGSIGKDDSRSDFSNYGSLVDIFAPGEDVLSTWPGSSTKQLSGTSMATPHITGLAAFIGARENYKVRSASAMTARIIQLATNNALSGLGANDVNRLPFNANPKG